LEQVSYDQERTEFLQSKRYRVLRFWNNEVANDLNAVTLAPTARTVFKSFWMH
jgi:very-short-patch-repair endonuclease